MNQDFNNFSQFEPPVLILCTPNRDELYTLPLAYSIKNILRYNALSELTFSYPKSKDGNATTDSAYDYIQGKMVVYIPNNGYYIIQACPEDNTGAVLIKNVTCYSLESEFLNFRVVGIKGTYDFLTLLGKIISYKPTWSLGDIDEDLYSLYRTFDETNTTGYNFMMVDMEKAFGCIFEFNTLTREVSAVLNTITPSSQSDIYLSFDNLIKKVEYKEISEEICTSMYCYGGNNLDIRDVNPLGTNNIYNFDYFKTTQWMSQELIDALDAWETKRDGYLTTFGDDMVMYNSLDIQKINYISERTDLIGKLKSVIVTKEARLELDPTASTTDLDTQIESYQYSIKSLEVSIQSVQNSMNTINSELREIVHDLYFTSKISYNNIRIDFFNILRSIEIIYSTFEDTYNENSDYPGFSIGLLTSLKPTILTAGEQAIEMATTLYSTFSAIFPTYPPDETAYIIPITANINSLIDYLETMNSSFQSLIPVTNTNTILYDIISKLHSYLNIISYSGNMTEDQYIELSPYIYENTYTNENIVAPTTENILGDNISIPDQIRIQSRALYDQSVDVLDKVSEPRYEFSGDFSNFVTVDDFSDFTSDLELGEIITVQKDDGTVIYAVLLELGISYDNPNDFSMVFSNRFRLATPGFIYTDVLGDATILGSSSSASGGITQGSVGGWGVSPAGMSLGNSSISSKGYISFGDAPPTAYGNFHGAWFGYDGAPRVSLFSNINNYLQWDGSKLLIKSEKFSLDSYGKITASEVNLSGRITATSGAIGGWIIETNEIYADDLGSKRVILNSENRYISFGITPPTSYGNNVGAWLGYDSVAKLSLYSDANNYFQWDGSKLVLKGTNFNLDTSLGGTIAGWTIATGSLYSGSGTTRVGIDSGGTNPSFYAGSETPASAPFRITNEGDLHVTTGEVDGDFQSTSFLEGATGWRIQGDGHAEFNEINLRGNIESVVFAQTKINTIAGQMYVSDGAVLIKDVGVDTDILALLHGDGVDGSTTITDEAGNTWTAGGDAQIDTDQYKFSSIGSSIKFDGTGDYITSPDNDKFAFAGDFTIDFWVRFEQIPTSGTYMTFYQQYVDASNRIGLFITNSSGVYYLWVIGASGGSSLVNIASIIPDAPVINTWYHYALVRFNDNWLMFVDGEQIGTTYPFVVTIPNFAAPVEVGRYATGLRYFRGWLAEYRISNVAIYTTNFTPPTSPYDYGGIQVDWNSFQSGDVVCLTSTTSADSEWMRVIDNGTAVTGGYRYSVTRNINLGGLGTFLPGDAVIRHGSSNAFEAGSIYFGAYEGVFGVDQPVAPATDVIVYAFGSTPVQGLGGWLDLNGTRTQGPYFGVWRRYGSEYNEVELVASFGNLDGFLYFTEEIYGIAIGDDNRHMVYTDENGLEIITSGGDTTINENGISTNALTASLNRVLVEDLIVQDTRCFISVSYLDAGAFDIILEGDSVLQIL